MSTAGDTLLSSATGCSFSLPADELVERVRVLAVERGEWPSQRRVMRECKVGAPRADAALAALRDEGFDPAPAQRLHAVPDASETQPEDVQERPESGAPGASEGAPAATVEAVSGRPQIDGEPLVEAPVGAPTSERRDWVADAGVLLVGSAAAVITFTTLRDLGLTVGLGGSVFGFERAWLLPVTVDVAGVVGTRVWLRGRAPDAAVRFARALTFAAIAASVVGNAGEHLMASLGLTPAWWVVVLVTAVPPLTLAAVVHLGHLIHAGGK